ncbi:DUF2271 domain-containing protein [Horticoccus sp. 23ND18S-11]|uniref:DUF2271 domain-containing protein n=1 Tax=Horticoccus sp. 23ND18S-11 TaxID=3391832 RepID=UPI0039C8EC06
MKRCVGCWPRLLVLCLGLAVAAQAAELTNWYTFNHEHVLGTSLELKFAARSEPDARRAETAALAEIDRLATILSGYDATSEFSRWIGTRNEPRPVSAELFEVLALFDQWRERTDGALDAAAEVTGRLWKSAAQQQRVPTTGELAAAVAAVRQTHWRLDAEKRTATHLTDAPLRLNSFAKSYIIEHAATAAATAGKLATTVVNLGGDLVVRGTGTETVALADPLADGENDAPDTRVAVRDRAVATSGGYRRGVEIGGRWYSHLVDPRTGRPVNHVLSATVTAPRATDAGALATALCVMTPEAGLKLAQSIPGAECRLLLNDGRRLTSAGWTELNVTPPAALHSGVHAAATKSNDAAPSAGAAWDPAFELVVNFEIASADGGRAKRPFVAIWIEDKDAFPLRTLALWFHGPRWLPDLRSWYRGDQLRAMAEGSQITASVSSATRAPGKYSVKWDGKDGHGAAVPAGKYAVVIEIAREHGSHQLVRRELDFSGGAQHVDLPGNLELASASLDYRRKGNGR